MKVIIADTKPIMIEGIKNALELMPKVNIVFTTNNGEHLLKIVDQTHPYLILSDIFLHGMAGLQVCKQLKQENEKLIYVFITSEVTDETIKLCQGAGADGILSNKLAKEKLVESLVRITNPSSRKVTKSGYT